MLSYLECVKIIVSKKDYNIKYYQSLYDFAVDLTICEKLTLREFAVVREILKGWEIDYLLGSSLSYKKAWLLNKLIEVDKFI